MNRTLAPAVGRSHTPTPATRSPHALVAGIAYLITFASSIPAVFLLNPVLHDPGFVTAVGGDAGVLWGCFLDLVNAVACVATAVAVFPVIRRSHESLAVGFVTSRLVEAAVILVGVVSLLAVVTLHQEYVAAGAGDASSVTTAAHALVTLRNWTFLLGPGLMPAVNAALFGTALFRSRLVPRIIPAIGLIGAPRSCCPRRSPPSSACWSRCRRSPGWPRSRSPVGSSPSASG